MLALAAPMFTLAAMFTVAGQLNVIGATLLFGAAGLWVGLGGGLVIAAATSAMRLRWRLGLRHAEAIASRSEARPRLKLPADLVCS